ncbi:MAG: TonB-dependent receptor [Verrucomicrobia bacterium]|nr:TonB-dependent receptor [Verrucomicrobiota bacterium]
MHVGAWGQAETNRPPSALPTLPELAVTASRMPREILEEPRTVYRLAGSAEAVDGRPARVMPDILKGVPSVMLQKTGYGQGSPFLRGFTGFRTLALIDGIRLNNSVFRDGPNQYWSTVDPLSIRDYELVMGPSSVLYGSDAIGGMLNATTVVPPVDADGHAVWERRVLYRGATAEDSNIGRLQLSGPLGGAARFVGGVSAKSFGDLEGGRDVGTQPHTGYDELDFDGRMDADVGDDGLLTVAFQSVDQDDAWRTHRTIYGIDWEGLARGDDKVHRFDQHRDLAYARYRQAALNAFLADDVAFTLSRHAQTEDLDRVRKDDTREAQGFDVETWGVTALANRESGWGDWVYGADYYHDSVDSYARRYAADGALTKVEIQGPVADDATYDLAGLFVENTVSLLDGHLQVTPGARQTFAAVDAGRVKDPVSGAATTLDDDWQASVASLRALVPLSEDRQHAVYASVAQGFRAPNLSDLTRLDSARSTELETPSPGLDPENFVAYEVGVKSRFRQLESQLTYYYTQIDGMIVRTPTGGMVDELVEVTKKNSGDGYVQGIEWSELWSATELWSLWLSATWMQGEADAYPTSVDVRERDDLSRVMPLTAQVGTRWRGLPRGGWLETTVDAAEKADQLSADDTRDTQRIPPGGTPGYAVWNLRAGMAVTQHLALTAAVENVLDEDYRIHGSGVNEPGRNFVLTAECRF